MPRRKGVRAKEVVRPRKTVNKAPADNEGFYADALSNGEKERLPEARQVEGLDEEITLLRVKLKQLVAKHPDDMDGIEKAVRLLLRAVATKYRLSPQAKNDLYESLAGVVKGIGGMMLPEAFKSDKEE